MRWSASIFAVLIMIPATVGWAQVPALERDALIAWYNSTNGAGWSDNTNWLGAEGTECTWSGVTCSGGFVVELDLANNQLIGNIPAEVGNLTNLSGLYLNGNRLTGNIPTEIGNLTNLHALDLSTNELGGSIPTEFGGLSSLQILYLARNQLSGSIPAEIGDLGGLDYLSLSFNHLSGSLPAAIGSLSGLHYLHLHCNQLTGSIPTEIGNLNGLDSMYLDYNALWTDDPTLQAFLATKNPGWADTQTIAPTGVLVTAAGDRTVWLEWTPIAYSADRGGYEVSSEPVGSGVITPRGMTSDKTATEFPVTGLEPGQDYDFRVKTVTFPNNMNPNTVVSDPSSPVMATTSDFGCATPTVSLGGGPEPITLTVTSVHDTYQWSTGETTAAIAVAPHRGTWYWVATTGPGSCAEAAVVYVPVLFADGFESGDTSIWSGVVH